MEQRVLAQKSVVCQPDIHWEDQRSLDRRPIRLFDSKPRGTDKEDEGFMIDSVKGTMTEF